MLQLGNTQVDEVKLSDLCRQYRVRELSFFGSAAHGEMRPDSDIDMLVEFLPDRSRGLRRLDVGSLASPREEGGSGLETWTETADPSFRARTSAALVCGMRAYASMI
jgi:predicted nucleotidyltransferase